MNLCVNFLEVEFGNSRWERNCAKLHEFDFVNCIHFKLLVCVNAIFRVHLVYILIDMTKRKCKKNDNNKKKKTKRMCRIKFFSFLFFYTKWMNVHRKEERTWHTPKALCVRFFFFCFVWFFLDIIFLAMLHCVEFISYHIII